MIGFPKYLNSKADYEYVINNFERALWMPKLQELLDNRFGWYPVVLEDVLNDETHKVENIQGHICQFEKRENPTAKIFQLGFTVEEIESILNQ